MLYIIELEWCSSEITRIADRASQSEGNIIEEELLIK